MTPAQFHQIRTNTGLSASDLAKRLRLETRTIHRYEDGTRKIPGPVEILMEQFQAISASPQSSF